jgi:predicted transcriptional regulator
MMRLEPMDKQKTKKQIRREVGERRKREHIMNVLWKMKDGGVREASARQIAEASDYRYSGSFSTYLNELCDDGYLRLEVYPYRGGRCSHRYTYMLPEKRKESVR